MTLYEWCIHRHTHAPLLVSYNLEATLTTTSSDKFLLFIKALQRNLLFVYLCKKISESIKSFWIIEAGFPRRAVQNLRKDEWWLTEWDRENWQEQRDMPCARNLPLTVGEGQRKWSSANGKEVLSVRASRDSWFSTFLTFRILPQSKLRA